MADHDLDQGTPTPQDEDMSTPTPQDEDTTNELTEGEENTAATEEKKEEEEEKPKRKPWYVKRIDDMTKKKYQLEKREKELMAEIEKLKNPSADGKVDEKDVDAVANKKAEGIAAEQKFNESCDKVAEIGKEKFKDFPERIANFGHLGGLGTQEGRAFLENVIEFDNAHEVLYALGDDLDRAADIFEMTPKRQAIALTKFAEELKVKAKKEAAPSKAPKPLKPITNPTSKPTPKDPDDMEYAEWLEWRNANKRVR